MQRRHWIGFASLAIIWGTTWLAVRVVVTEAPPFLSAGIRFVLAALLLGAVVKWRGLPLGWTKYQPDERRLMLELSVWMIAIPYALVFWGEQFITAGLAGVLFSTHSVFMVLLESLRQRRNILTGKILAGILLAFGGVVVIFWPRLGVPEEWLGALALLGAAASSSFAAIRAKYKAPQLDPMVTVTWQMGIGAVPLLFLGVWLEAGSATNASLKAWLSLAYLVVFGSCVAFVLYFWLLKKLTTVQISTMAYVTPVVAVTSGWLLLDETLGLSTLAGAAMALAGVFLLHSKERDAVPSGD